MTLWFLTVALEFLSLNNSVRHIALYLFWPLSFILILPHYHCDTSKHKYKVKFYRAWVETWKCVVIFMTVMFSFSKQFLFVESITYVPPFPPLTLSAYPYPLLPQAFSPYCLWYDIYIFLINSNIIWKWTWENIMGLMEILCMLI